MRRCGQTAPAAASADQGGAGNAGTAASQLPEGLLHVPPCLPGRWLGGAGQIVLPHIVAVSGLSAMRQPASARRRCRDIGPQCPGTGYLISGTGRSRRRRQHRPTHQVVRGQSAPAAARTRRRHVRIWDRPTRVYRTTRARTAKAVSRLVSSTHPWGAGSVGSPGRSWADSGAALGCHGEEFGWVSCRIRRRCGNPTRSAVVGYAQAPRAEVIEIERPGTASIPARFVHLHRHLER
jgi:hypothetical protein